MWRPSVASVCKLLSVAMLLGTAAPAEACLFPWFWGGYYAPPPAYYGPPAYGGPAYAPSPCGPGGCSSYYAPQTCCAPCGVGCSPCGAGGCASGNCGVDYSSNLSPQPDDRPTPSEKTYADPPQPGSVDGMPDDDFGPTQRGTGGAGEQPDPFIDPITPEGIITPEDADPAPVQPMGDEAIPGAAPVQFIPIRQRTFAQARYRVPRVARLHVEPQTTPWMTPAVSRLAKR